MKAHRPHARSLTALGVALPHAAAYTRAVALDPTRVAARANLGNVLLVLGRPREAIVHYEEAVRLAPADPRAHENLALAREALRSAPNR